MPATPDPASAVIFLSVVGFLTAVVIALAAYLETGFVSSGFWGGADTIG